MIRIADLTKTTSAYPTQWEGTTTDNRSIYIRFRNGWLSVQISQPNGTLEDAVNTDPIYEEDVGDAYDLSDHDMHEHTQHLIAWATPS